MHRSRIGGIIIDCRTDDLKSAADFWSAALGYPVRDRPDLEGGRYVDLQTPPNDIGVTVQQVDHPSWVHIDIETDDFEAETRRLEALGARVEYRKEKWVTMVAPTGHRFCLIGQERADLPENGNRWE